MKIRLKLMVLVAGLVLLFALSASVYVVGNGYIQGIKTEATALQDLTLSVNLLRSEVNRMDSRTFGSIEIGLSDAKDQLAASFEEIDGLRRLKALGGEAKGVFQNLQSVRDTIDAKLASTSAAQGDFTAEIRDSIQVDPSYYSMTQVSDFAFTVLTVEQRKSLIATRNKYAAEILSFDQVLEMQDKVIKAQIEVIDGAVAAMQIKVGIATFALVALFIVIALVVATRIAARLTASIEGMGKSAAILDSGDLTGRFEKTSHDEVGTLAEALNAFVATLRGSIAGIHSASGRNVEVRDLLLGEVQEASSSIAQIESNSESIARQIEKLNDQVSLTGEEVTAVSAQIESLHLDIKRHNETVAAASGEIDTVIGSLEEVVRVVDEGRSASSLLASSVEKSRDELAETYRSVTRINESAGTIREITGVMAGIAARTNLLAMNAAIEAAHAGEFGQGFAVVADEIRSLAEASSARSKEIGKNIGTIVGEIEQTQALAENANKTFDGMIDRLGDMTASINTIQAGIADTSANSESVSRAMRDLNGISAKIASSSDAMSKSSATIDVTAKDLGRISHEVFTNIAEITKGIHHIGDTVRSVAAHAEAVGEVSGALDGEVKFFKV